MAGYDWYITKIYHYTTDRWLTEVWRAMTHIWQRYDRIWMIYGRGMIDYDCYVTEVGQDMTNTWQVMTSILCDNFSNLHSIFIDSIEHEERIRFAEEVFLVKSLASELHLGLFLYESKKFKIDLREWCHISPQNKCSGQLNWRKTWREGR